MYLLTDSALLRAIALIVAIASAQAQSTPNVFNISRIEPPYITGKEASRLTVWVDVSTSDADSCTSVKIGNILQGLSCSRLDSTSFAVAVSADIHSYALDCASSSSQIGGWSTYASIEIRAGQYVFSSSSANLLEVRFPSTVKAPPSSLQLFVLSLSAVMKILLCASGGAFLSHLGLLDAATASKIGKITTTMLLPALLFCSLSESMTLDAFSRLWFLPVSCVFYILFATAAAFLCGWAMRLPPTIRAVAAGCAGFGNAQGFPLVLISTIAEKLYDAEKQQLGLAYLSVYLIAHSSLLWGLAPMVVRSRVKQPLNPESSEADNIPMVQTDAQAPHSPDTSLAAPECDHHEDHHEGAMGTSDGGHDYVSSQRIRAAVRRASALAESGAHDCMKYANKVADAIPPPVRGVLLGMFVGSVPFLRSWFVAKDGWANFAWKAADMLGKAAVPFSTMMMGVNVYFSLKVLFKVGFKASGLSSMTKPIIIAVLVRYLLLPIFGRLLLALGVALQLMPSTREDPIFSLMILLQSFTPSANNIILVVDAECRSHDGTPDATAKSTTTYCQLSQYVLAPFAISILTALSLDFIQNA